MKRLILSLISVAAIMSLDAQTVLNVQTNKPVGTVNPDMYGIFFEDINFAADGGLYGELVKNRSFEFPQSLMGWKTFGHVEVMSEGGPFERNPHYVRLTSSLHHDKYTGLENEGFLKGMGFKDGETYRFSVWARSLNGKPQKIRIELIGSDNNIFKNGGKEKSAATVTVDSKEWKKYSVEIKSYATDAHAIMRIFYDNRNDGAIDLEHISLFPKDTWMGHENGMRKDLAQALYDLHPGVFRFPGGCIVEGTDLATRYQWKNSVGPVENRPLNENRWHYTFADRLFPDYFQSYGLGFYEFFCLAEEIGATALPVLSVGLACQYQNNDMSAHVPLDELQPYIDDALDLIEFANGSTDTKWGGLRAEMGHPEPFNLKYISIGNEQWGQEFIDRLEPFVKAIRAAYPKIQIVGSSGPLAEGDKFDFLWPEMARLKADLVDEHYYKAPEWFFTNAARYDNYDRKGPKVFAGEYASHDYLRGKANNFRAALSEACFLTGVERNADVVRLATYAPLFAHVDGWQWNPDMIWYDNLRSMRTPNWYVQQLYSLYKGTHILKATDADNQPFAGQEGLFASAVRDDNAKTLIVKVGNSTPEPETFNINLLGVKNVGYKVKLIRMQEDDQDVVNTLDNPEMVVPKESEFTIDSPNFSLQVQPQSFNVLIIPLQ